MLFRSSAASEHFSELLGCPISGPSLRLALVLNQGPFPPPALPGFIGTAGPSATLQRPDLPSRASGWSSQTTPEGLPVLRALPWCTCHRHYPGAATGCFVCSLPQPCQPSPVWQPGRPAHRPFRGLFSVHSRYSLHTRAATVFRGTHHRRLQPLRYLRSCSGCFRLEHLAGWDFNPLGKRRLLTAHAKSGQLPCWRQLPDTGPVTRRDSDPSPSTW